MLSPIGELTSYAARNRRSHRPVIFLMDRVHSSLHQLLLSDAHCFSVLARNDNEEIATGEHAALTFE